MRIGQIVPSRGPGRSKLWNPNEMIPLVVRSGNVIGCLPDRMGIGGCEWLEVGVVANFVVDVCASENKSKKGNENDKKRLVYNVVHPKSFSWKEEFLPLLRDAGMEFETVGYQEWLEKLRRSEVDVERNPSRKLLEFWKTAKTRAESRGAVKFDTNAGEDVCVTLRDALKIVNGDLVKELVESWRKTW